MLITIYNKVNLSLWSFQTPIFSKVTLIVNYTLFLVSHVTYPGFMSPTYYAESTCGFLGIFSRSSSLLEKKTVVPLAAYTSALRLEGTWCDNCVLTHSEKGTNEKKWTFHTQKVSTASCISFTISNSSNIMGKTNIKIYINMTYSWRLILNISRFMIDYSKYKYMISFINVNAMNHCVLYHSKYIN